MSSAMDLSRPEYPAMLDSLQPSQATVLLSDRIKHVGRVNLEIADWLQERRRIEELYASALRKLSQREPPSDSSDLGIFTTPWQKVVSSAASIAESHRVLALKIETDIEKPLRDFTSTNREVQAMSTMQGNLQSLAKDYESAQKKSDKLNKAGKSPATKVATASSEMDNASSQWTSQAPYVFEALQALDESRCNHLRDALTQYQTHEVDLVEKNRKTAENTLNSILNIETANEIKTFAAKSTRSGQTDTRRMSERRLSRSQPSATLVPPVSSPAPDDRASQRSASVHEEKKGRLGGLRRLGTVMRRKSTVPSSYAKAPSGSKGSASNLPAGTTANGDQSNLTRETTATSLQGWRPPSAGFFPNALEQTPTSTQAATTTAPRELQSQDGSTSRDINQSNSTALNGSAHQSDLAELQGAISPQPPAPPVSTPQETTRDAEGFSVPSTTIDPISQAEQEAIASDPSSSQLKVDIRNAPITEESADADSAMANMANTLRAQAAPPRRSGTNRGRRDVRSAIITPTAAAEAPISEQAVSPPPPITSSPVSMAPFASPFQAVQPAPASPPPVQRPSASEASDSQSIMSSRSGTTLGATTRHPSMQTPGLNSSIIETVSAWLEHGSVTRSLVIGELALAFVATSSTEVPLSTNIRLENFSALEKVAPNPAFVTQVDEQAKAGEYTIDTNSLARSAGSPAVAFKYQVHVSEANVSHQAPIILTPSWKVEEKQTSVILSYSLNPAFTSPISLSNVTLSIILEPNESGTGRPTSCQSKPAGVFSKERNMIYWRLDELSLTPGAGSQKVLARFATEGQAKPGKVEARWELNGNSDSALGLGSSLYVSQLEGAGASSDPFADDSVAGTWKSMSSLRKLVSGTYVAT